MTSDPTNESQLTATWKPLYETRLVSADKAIRSIEPDSAIVVGHSVGEPQELLEALVRNMDHFRNATITHMIALGKCKYLHDGMEKHFRHNSLFVGSPSRRAVNEGRADFTPFVFSQLPRFFRERIIPVDVALVQLSPPDQDGYCSFGVSVDYTKQAAECAQMVIAQVNKNMPYTFGDSRVHISKIDCIVEFDEPLIERPYSSIGSIERKIGEYVSTLIDDGSVIQTGIGSIPDAILASLEEKKNLGIHTELLSNNAISLIENGIVNNSTKRINHRKTIANQIMGNRKLYDFIDHNPEIEMYPVDYTNDPTIIGRNDKVVAINSAIEVDLTGQICAESIGWEEYSGTGGQIDFVRGASISKGGKSVIAMPSTAKNREVSRIVPFLREGATVTTTRNDAHYVVTEYGIADLKGKSLRERAKLLIDIAHPSFRKDLEKYLKGKWTQI